MADQLIAELVKQAANKNAAMVDPVGRTSVPEHEGSSKLAKILFLAGLGADVGTTAYGSMSGKTHEANPMVKWAGEKGAAPAVAGMGVGTLLLSKLIGKSHPKIADALLMGMGGAHGVAAMGNLHEIGKSAPADKSAPTSSSAPRPGMVQGPDGSWYDPNFLTVK